jgi:hypothetical protein
MKKRGEIHENSMNHVVLRKPHDRAFVAPMQGYYAGNISTSARDDWSKMR